MSFLIQWESGRTRQNLLHSVGESKAKGQTASAFFRAPCQSSVLTELVLFCSAKLPHTGQSSQLLIEAINGNAQFLSTGARSALVPANYRHSAQSDHPLAVAHTGQSSQLVSDANDLMAFSLREIPDCSVRSLRILSSRPDRSQTAFREKYVLASHIQIAIRKCCQTVHDTVRIVQQHLELTVAS